jgi:3-oxoacyl-[acyl-carrier-protein] synthase-3
MMRKRGKSLRARITGTGSHYPERILANVDLEKMVDTSDEWITERTGVKERRIAEGKHSAASDLACKASRAALDAASLKPKELDLIIVGTVTGDMPMPSTACILQDKLGAKNAAAFDVNAACSGFLYGLSVGESFIRSQTYETVLVVGTEVLSKFLDWEDRSTCVLFGDGAGAAVLEPTEKEEGILSVDIRSDGSLGSLLTIPAGGSELPPSQDTLREGLHFIKMKGNETFKAAVKSLEKVAVETLKKNKIKPSDLALLIPHQANLRIIQATAKRLKIPMERVFLNLERYGNTSAASIPIALDEAVRSLRIREGDYILLEAFGAGLTWASALIKW